MHVIKRGPAFLGEGVAKEFAGSLRAADLAESTRRGYASYLGRFRSWIEQSRGTQVPLRRISTADLASYRFRLSCSYLNPKTGAPVAVQPKKVPYFKPSKNLRDLNAAGSERAGKGEASGTVQTDADKTRIEDGH